MSKKLIVVSILAGIVLTLLSYLLTGPATNYQCSAAPANPGALSELSIYQGQVRDHGFPLRFYASGSRSNCMLLDGDNADGPTVIRSHFNRKNLFLDYAVWSIVSGIIIGSAKSVIRKRNAPSAKGNKRP